MNPDTPTLPLTAIPTVTISPTSTPEPSPTLQQAQAGDVIFFTANEVMLSGTLFISEEKADIGVVLAQSSVLGREQRTEERSEK